MVQKIIGDKLMTDNRQTDRQTDRQTGRPNPYAKFFFFANGRENKWGESYTSLLAGG